MHSLHWHCHGYSASLSCSRAATVMQGCWHLVSKAGMECNVWRTARVGILMHAYGRGSGKVLIKQLSSAAHGGETIAGLGGDVKNSSKG